MTKSQLTTAFLTLSILLISCGTPSSAKPVSPASSAQKTGIAETTPVPSTSPAMYVVDTSTLPQSFAALGTPCGGPETGDVVERQLVCAKDGRVAGVYQPADFLHQSPPDSAEILVESRTPPNLPASRGESLMVALDGQRLWIRKITCSACRRIIGTAFIGELPMMESDDLLKLQRLLSLPADIPLTSPDHWRAAYLPEGSEHRRE